MASISRFAAAPLVDPPPSTQHVKFFKEQSRLRAAMRPTAREIDPRGTALANLADTRSAGGEGALRELELPLPE